MKRAGINELMGSKGTVAKQRELSLDDLGEILGEKMPKLEFSPRGRLRLTTALRNRFGDGYKNIPGIDKIIKEFEDEAKFRVKVEKMKQIKAKGSK